MIEPAIIFETPLVSSGAGLKGNARGMNVINSPRWGLDKWKDHFSNIFIVRLHTLICV